MAADGGTWGHTSRKMSRALRSMTAPLFIALRSRMPTPSNVWKSSSPTRRRKASQSGSCSTAPEKRVSQSTSTMSERGGRPYSPP